VRFGMTRDEVRELLGKPEERDRSPVGSDESEAWYFRSRGLSLHFDSDVDWRLTTIEVGLPEAELDGQKLVGMTVEQLRAAHPGRLLAWNGDEFEPMTIDAWSMNLWIEDGVLGDIQWSVPFGADDRECWPG
jgi:hypothetical protein